MPLARNVASVDRDTEPADLVRDRPRYKSRHGRQWAPTLLHWAYAVVILVLGFAGNIPILQTDAGWALIYVACGLLFVLRLVHSRMYLAIEPGIVLLGLFVVIVVVSGAMSDYPWQSLRTVVALIGTTLLGLYLGVAFTTRQLIGLVFGSGLFVALASVMAVAVIPDVAIDRTNVVVGWQGVLLHKNALGVAMALLAATAAVRFRWGDGSRWLSGIGLTAAVVVAYGTSSRTGLLSALLLTLVALVLPRTKDNGQMVGRGVILLALTGMAAAVLAVILYYTSESVRQLVDSNLYRLTGRANIWSGVLASIEDRPLLGYGYGGFWHELQGPSVQVIEAVYGYVPSAIEGFVPEHAHNMILEVALASGFIGVTVFLAYVTLYLIRSLTLALLRPALETHFYVVFAGLVILYSPVESILPMYQSSYWMVFIALSVRVAGRVQKAPLFQV